MSFRRIFKVIQWEVYPVLSVAEDNGSEVRGLGSNMGRQMVLGLLQFIPSFIDISQ